MPTGTKKITTKRIVATAKKRGTSAKEVASRAWSAPKKEGVSGKRSVPATTRKLSRPAARRSISRTMKKAA